MSTLINNITKRSNAVNHPKLTHGGLVCIQESREVANMINSELEQMVHHE
jgi:hypothetical protein